MEIDYAGFSIKGKSHKFNEDRYRMLGEKAPLISDSVLKAIDLKMLAQKVRKWIFNSLEYSAKSLCELAKMRGSADDITAVIVEIIEFDV
ncbi:MAG: hypothetical protein HOJ48_12395 [Desulfobacula sp.]|jgi:serine/threonine protein phosphatase PrpC|nr:hypothetical protein [Desulfobacula sp.]MBT7261427.1 hypothetical protein [Desulfobacula sp.]